MNEPSAGEVTELLVGWNRGDEDALGKLLPIVYDELHRLASRYLRHERPEHILQSTALVHEAYMRLTDKKDVPWRNRTHFYAIAARMMRQVLVDSARRRDAAKRRGMKISLSETLSAEAADPVDLISLNDALTALAALNARQARVRLRTAPSLRAMGPGAAGPAVRGPEGRGEASRRAHCTSRARA